MRDRVAEQDQLPRTTAVLQSGRERGLHDAARVHVRLLGGATLETSIGEVTGGHLVDDDTRFSWTCATKPLAAIGLGVLVDRGALRFDDLLSHWIPEAPPGWGPIRLHHLLTHTVGWVGDPGLVAAVTDGQVALHHVLRHAQLQPEWAPGSRAAYSVWTGWLLLGEVLQRAAEEDVASWLSREVLLPAGMGRTRLALSPDELRDLGPRLALLQHRSGAAHPYLLDGPHHAHQCWPGLSARGPTSDLTRLFEALLLDGRGAGPGVLSPATATAIVQPVRRDLVDEATGTDHAWGLGVTVDRRAIHPRAPIGTFSHSGLAGSTLVFADPRRVLVAALTTDGIPGGLPAVARRFGFAQALYADLHERREVATEPQAVPR